MIPAAQYAQKREEAIELIRAHAPARLQEPLIDLLRPAIALSATRADDAEIPLGASKFGGAPTQMAHISLFLIFAGQLSSGKNVVLK